MDRRRHAISFFDEQFLSIDIAYQIFNFLHSFDRVTFSLLNHFCLNVSRYYTSNKLIEYIPCPLRDLNKREIKHYYNIVNGNFNVHNGEIIDFNLINKYSLSNDVTKTLIAVTRKGIQHFNVNCSKFGDLMINSGEFKHHKTVLSVSNLSNSTYSKINISANNQYCFLNDGKLCRFFCPSAEKMEVLDNDFFEFQDTPKISSICPNSQVAYTTNENPNEFKVVNNDVYQLISVSEEIIAIKFDGSFRLLVYTKNKIYYYRINESSPKKKSQSRTSDESDDCSEVTFIDTLECNDPQA